MNNAIWSPFDGADARRIQAIVGHYGSGKTEIALNLALRLRDRGQRACVVDLDIVNPFFRSAERHELLKERGVELIHPPFALTGVDIPVLGADVERIFSDHSLFSILDVGGDDAGAAALGKYKPRFEREPIGVCYVVNVFRPFSKTVAQIVDMIGRIQLRARVPVTHLINNANLGDATEPAHILEGQRILAQVARETGIPIAAVSGLPSVLSQLPALDVPSLPLARLLKPEWME